MNHRLEWTSYLIKHSYLINTGWRISSLQARMPTLRRKKERRKTLTEKYYHWSLNKFLRNQIKEKPLFVIYIYILADITPTLFDKYCCTVFSLFIITFLIIFWFIHNRITYRGRNKNIAETFIFFSSFFHLTSLNVQGF